MELKKYILLNEVCNNLIVKFDDVNFDSGVVAFRSPKENQEYMLRYDWVVKKSDNILDLVEVGDLVEDKFNNILKVEAIYPNDEGDNQYYCIFDTWQEDEITAIYKKQPNGDYKRYEVK